ncbi:MAG: HlyD family type I secretion periplasmic adaptor subunit [Magnetococcales bacterium]|nr:HlyD family type I secretion periplasmic adaptor subunit [Magnetococcales bacterium]MBF0156096.1 HlyD family type I secretion periplasmic adaptor subunit [Magnetococcales bacterium]
MPEPLPAAVPERGPGGRLLLLGTLFVALLLLWAALGRLDVVSFATGEVVPQGRVKALQHLEGGIVEAILVREGSVVRKGEALLRLDSLRAVAESEEIQARIQGLRVDVARLTAEASLASEPLFPEGVAEKLPRLVEDARSLFASRLRRFRAEQAVLEAVVVQRQEELKEIRARLDSSRKSLELLESQVGISQKLLAQSLTSQMLHYDLLRQQQGLRGQIATDQAAAPRVEAAITEARGHLEQLRATFVEKAVSELSQARQNLDELAERARKFEDARQRTVLRAPVDGVVKSLGVATEGGVIQASQTVMEIVPLDDRLVIEARLPVAEIGYVHVGQRARLTLASADAALFGAIAGAVTHVSPDASVSAQGAPHYRIRILPDADRFDHHGRVYRLYPGVQVTCAILVGERSVLAYLFSPLVSSWGFALQER